MIWFKALIFIFTFIINCQGLFLIWFCVVANEILPLQQRDFTRKRFHSCPKWQCYKSNKCKMEKNVWKRSHWFICRYFGVEISLYTWSLDAEARGAHWILLLSASLLRSLFSAFFFFSSSSSSPGSTSCD